MDTLKRIYNYVNEKLDIDIKEDTRKREYAAGRALFYGLAKSLTKETLGTIGNYLGRDHTTVIHGIKNILPIIDKNLVANAYTYFENTEALPDNFFKKLQLDNNKLKYKLEKAEKVIKKMPSLIKISEILEELDENQCTKLVERMEASAYMIKKEKHYNLEPKQMEGAIR